MMSLMVLLRRLEQLLLPGLLAPGGRRPSRRRQPLLREYLANPGRQLKLQRSRLLNPLPDLMRRGIYEQSLNLLTFAYFMVNLILGARVAFVETQRVNRTTKERSIVT